MCLSRPIMPVSSTGQVHLASTAGERQVLVTLLKFDPEAGGCGFALASDAHGAITFLKSPDATASG